MRDEIQGVLQNTWTKYREIERKTCNLLLRKSNGNMVCTWFGSVLKRKKYTHPMTNNFCFSANSSLQLIRVANIIECGVKCTCIGISDQFDQLCSTLFHKVPSLFVKNTHPKKRNHLILLDLIFPSSTEKVWQNHLKSSTSGDVTKCQSLLKLPTSPPTALPTP